MMRLLFKHFDPVEITQVIVPGGLNPNMPSNSSLETCWQKTDGLAERLKQDYENFFFSISRPDVLYLKSDIANLLLHICNFNFNDTPKQIIDKMATLGSILFCGTSIPTESQSEGSEALERAEQAESKFISGAPHIYHIEVYDDVVESYIEAANAGNVIARMWLKTVAKSGNFTAHGQKWENESTIARECNSHGQIWIALGDIRKTENAAQDEINSCYEKGWQILFTNAKKGNCHAIKILYGKSIGVRSTEHINQTLDALLLTQIASLTLLTQLTFSNSPSEIAANTKDKLQNAKDWIWNVFDDLNFFYSVDSCPPFYKAKQEEAYLALMKSMIYDDDKKEPWELFRNDVKNDAAINVLESALSKVLLLSPSPIELSVRTKWNDPDQIVITAKHSYDNDKFIAAIDKSDFAQFFSPSVILGHHSWDPTVITNCLELGPASWSRFIALLTDLNHALQ